MDTIIMGEDIGTDHLAMNLSFTKKRRRTSANFEDFADVSVELLDD